jgi:hypothetical protein
VEELTKLVRSIRFLVAVILFWIVAGICFNQLAHADDWTVAESGCYTYRVIKANDVTAISIQVADTLTLDKGTVARSAKEAEKLLNDKGKTLHGKLFKLPDAQVVSIGDRSIGVRVYPFPTDLVDKVLPQALGIVDEVLCGGQK